MEKLNLKFGTKILKISLNLEKKFIAKELMPAANRHFELAGV